MLYDGNSSNIHKISAVYLSEFLGVSRTPVNMALHRLETEGLLVKDAAGNWNLPQLDMNELDSIMDIKERIFPLAVRQATIHPSPDMVIKLLIFIDEMERAIHYNEISSWQAADTGHTQLLFSAAGNGRLTRFHKTLDFQLYRLRRGYMAMQGGQKIRLDGLRSLTLSISSGDADEAEIKALNYCRDLRVELTKVMKQIVIPFLGLKSI